MNAHRRLGVLTVAATLLLTQTAACGGSDDGAAAPTTAAVASSAAAGPSSSATATSGGAAPTTAAAATAPSSTAPPITVRPALEQVQASLQELATFDEPVAFATRREDPHIYVVERTGVIKAMTGDGDVVQTPVADLTSLTAPGGERGLLGLAFSPDGTRLYVNYTDLDGHTNVDELTVAGSDGAAVVAAAASRRRLLFVEQPYANHNGGHLEFGPDGMLYIGMGDGGSGGDPHGNGQDLSTLLGKLLRIDPAPSPDGSLPYTIPADNPYVGRAGARPEVWSYGLRNPWGFSFDRATGDLWLADVGQDEVEEVNVVRAADSPGGAGKGVNFGWNAFEGTVRYDDSTEAPGALAPIHEYGHGGADGQGCSVTGGVVYRNDTVAQLNGAYLFADYCVAGVRALEATGDINPRTLLQDPTSVSGFGLDPDGEVLVASLDGGVYRLR